MARLGARYKDGRFAGSRFEDLGLRLRSSGSLLAAYAANGFTPALGFDFVNSVYAVGSAATTVNFERSGAATMVDSDGVLKWAPHNLVPYSESLQDNSNDDLTVTAMSGGDGPISAYALLTPDATTSAHGLTSIGIASVVDGAQHTVECYAKAGGGSFIQIDTGATAARYANFDLSGGGAVGTIGTQTVSADITALANGWFHLKMVYVPAADNQTTSIFLITTATAARREIWTATGSETVLVTGMRVYRSDLGGMADNPETGDSYVPTTATARYLPRVGSHVYDGSTWVNEGLRFEEAGTNLFTYSVLSEAALQSTAQTLGSNVTIDAGANGITAEVVATGVENGIPYLDWDISGTNGGSTVFIDLSDSARVSAAQGDTYTISAYLRLLSGSIASANVVQLFCHFRSAGETLLESPTSEIGTQIDGTLTRFSAALTASHVDTANIGDKGLYLRISGGATVGFRLRVGLPQVEETGQPTSPIPTTGAQADRTLDTVSLDSFSYDGTTMWGAIQGVETFADLGTADQVLLLDWRADANNRITVSIDTDGVETGEITLTMINGGVSATAAVDYLTPGVNQPMGIGWRVTGSDIAVSVGGGTAVATATAIGIPDLSSADATFSGNGFRALFTQGIGACGDAGIEEISA